MTEHTHRVICTRSDGRAREWNRYPSQESATDACRALLRAGINAYAESLMAPSGDFGNPDPSGICERTPQKTATSPPAEEPEHRGDRVIAGRLWVDAEAFDRVLLSVGQAAGRAHGLRLVTGTEARP